MSVIDEIMAMHTPLGAYVCRRCLSWGEPCDVQELGREVERLRGVVAERDREIERMALRYGMRQLAALEEGE